MVITINIGNTCDDIGNRIMSMVSDKIRDEIGNSSILWAEVDWLEVVNSYLNDYSAVAIMTSNNQLSQITFRNDALYTYCLLELSRYEP